MSKISLHVYRGSDAGIESCDFRGDKMIGDPHGSPAVPTDATHPLDDHRTVLELKNAPDDLVEVALLEGPKINTLFDHFKTVEPEGLQAIATALGLGGDGPVGLRLGVWD